MHHKSMLAAPTVAVALFFGAITNAQEPQYIVNSELGNTTTKNEDMLISAATGIDSKNNDDLSTKSALGLGLMQTAQQAASGHTASALLSLGETAVDFWLPSLGQNLPEWAKHIETELEVNENNVPHWSVLGVFPLFESEDLQNTLFTQISQRRYRLLGINRDVTNVGLGYRRLFLENTVLLGVNGFFDYDWKYNHQRVSSGFEAKWAGLDFGANAYWKASDVHTADAGNTEEVLGGHDFRLASQIPYVPWARIHGRRYWWKTVSLDEDIKGWEAGLEMDIHQSLQIESGARSDNFINDNDNAEYYMKMRFILDLGNKPVALSSNWVSGNPWLMRDMSEYRLEKVRRENKIIVERRASGVVITRGN